MDGTILCEKAPIYVDSCLTMYRVLDDPTYAATEEERASMQEMRDHAYATGEHYDPAGLTKNDLIASAFSGMTPEEFRAYVASFADTVDAVGFSGMTYGQSFYRPMLEVIDFLRSCGYDIWMVSACEREVVRGLVERLGIPMDHVVATDVVYAASGSNGTVADEYNMGRDESIVLTGPLNEIECGKPAAIAREIGSARSWPSATAPAISPCSTMPRAIRITRAWAYWSCAMTQSANTAAKPRPPVSMPRWRKRAGRPSPWPMTGSPSTAKAWKKTDLPGSSAEEAPADAA